MKGELKLGNFLKINFHKQRKKQHNSKLLNL